MNINWCHKCKNNGCWVDDDWPNIEASAFNIGFIQQYHEGVWQQRAILSSDLELFSKSV